MGEDAGSFPVLEMKENGKWRGRVQFNRRTLVLPCQNYLYTGDGKFFYEKGKTCTSFLLAFSTPSLSSGPSP